MMYSVDYRVSFEELDAKCLSQDDVIRRIATKMIIDMEVNDVKKLFNIKLYDPRSTEMRDKVRSEHPDHWIGNLFASLHEQKLILFESKLIID